MLQALKLYAKALEQEPSNPRVLHSMAQCFMKQGKVEVCLLSHFTCLGVLCIHHMCPSTWTSSLLVPAPSLPVSLQEAKRAFESILDIEPDNGFTLHSLGQLKVAEGNQPRASELFKEGLHCKGADSAHRVG